MIAALVAAPVLTEFPLLGRYLGFTPARAQTSRASLSVKDFGAKGDGSTDDGLAIEAAIRIVKSVGGGTVLLPEGIYLIDQISVGSNSDGVNPSIVGVSLVGASRRMTVLKQARGARGWAISLIDARDCSVRSLTIDSSEAVIEGGLRTFCCQDVVIEDIEVLDPDRNGIVVSGPQFGYGTLSPENATVRNCVVLGQRTWDGDATASILAGNGARRTLFLGCLAEASASFTGDLFGADNAPETTFENCMAIGRSLPRILIEGDGSGAAAYAEVSDGIIKKIIVSNRGESYSSATVRILSGRGSEARATTTLVGGSVTKIAVIAGGIGYGDGAYNGGFWIEGAEAPTTSTLRHCQVIDCNLGIGQSEQARAVVKDATLYNCGAAGASLWCRTKNGLTVEDTRLIACGVHDKDEVSSGCIMSESGGIFTNVIFEDTPANVAANVNVYSAGSSSQDGTLSLLGCSFDKSVFFYEDNGPPSATIADCSFAAGAYIRAYNAHRVRVSVERCNFVNLAFDLFRIGSITAVRNLFRRLPNYEGRAIRSRGDRLIAVFDDNVFENYRRSQTHEIVAGSYQFRGSQYID